MRVRRVRARRLGAPAALLALLAVIASPAAGETPGDIALTPDPQAVLAELVQDVGGRGASQSPERYAYLRKLDGQLQAVAASRLGTGDPARAAVSAARQGDHDSPGGEVPVDVYVTAMSRAAADALRALGMRVTGDRATARRSAWSRASCRPAALPAAAALPATRAILAPFSNLSTGSVALAGRRCDPRPAGARVRPTGAGVTVGIISDSIDQVGGGHRGLAGRRETCRPTSQNLSDLPGGTDEGRAMAEIVYDEAPGISGIVFATAAGGPQAKATSIDSLVSHGVKVIADDTSYITEPFFQDDVVAQAVDRAKADGRRLSHRRGERRRPELGGHLQRRGRQPGLRSGPGDGHHPDDRDDPGRRDRRRSCSSGRSRGARRRRISTSTSTTPAAAMPALLGTAQDIDTVATGIPDGVRRRDRAGPRLADARDRGSAAWPARASPFMKYIAYTNGARR